MRVALLAALTRHQDHDQRWNGMGTPAHSSRWVVRWGPVGGPFLPPARPPADTPHPPGCRCFRPRPAARGSSCTSARTRAGRRWPRPRGPWPRWQWRSPARRGSWGRRRRSLSSSCQRRFGWWRCSPSCPWRSDGTELQEARWRRGAAQVRHWAGFGPGAPHALL